MIATEQLKRCHAELLSDLNSCGTAKRRKAQKLFVPTSFQKDKCTSASSGTKQECVDCTIQTKSRELKANWKLLSRVPYFYALNSFTNTSETSTDVINLKEFTEDSIKLMLEYLQKGACNISEAELADLLHVADYLRIEPLIKECMISLHSFLLSQKISIRAAHHLISRHNLGIDRYLLYSICDIAVELGYLPLIQYGLSLGMNPNICYEDLRSVKSGHNIFFKAVINGHIDAVILLLDAGANVNYQKISSTCVSLLEEFETPWIENLHAIKLRYSPQNGNGGYLCTTSRGMTVLHIAVCNNRLDMIKLFMNHGAKIQADQDGETPIHVATYFGNKEILKFFVEQGCAPLFNIHSNIMGTPLFRAVIAGHIDVLKYMIQNGADVNATDYIGFSISSYAAVSNNLDLLKYLTETLCLSLTEQNDTHETALHQCASLGQVDIIKYCISKEPSLMHVQDERGDTLLHVAVLYDQMSTAAALIDAGSDVNIPNYLNEQPLHIALMENCTEILPNLLKAGANPNAILNIRDTSTPLTLAIMCGGETTLDYVRLLLRYGASPRQLHDKALILALKENIQQKEETVVELLRHGADSNARCQGSPVLVDVCAIPNVSLNLVKLLLNYGANVNIANRKGITALMAACNRGRVDLVELLLKYGADIHKKSWQGLCAISLVKDNTIPNGQSILQLLTNLSTENLFPSFN